MVDSRWIEWKDADRFDTYPAPISCALGWVALLLDFHLSRYQISLSPSLFIPLPSNTDGSSIPNRRVCARWLGRARNRRSNGRYRSIPPPPRYVLPPRWNDVLFCVNRPPYLFIHRRRHSNMISCTSSSSSKLLSHRSATSYNMTKHGKELEKKGWMKKSSCCCYRCVFVQPSGSGWRFYTSRNWNAGMKRIYCISSGGCFYWR
jgi:hypothetical protein